MGEIVILGVTNTTATGMIVFALEDVHAGDGIELDTVELISPLSKSQTGNGKPFPVLL